MKPSANEDVRHSNGPVPPGVLVTTSWLAAHLDDANLRILDVRQPAHYVRGHIAGARNAPLEIWSCTVDGVEGMVLPSDAYAGMMSRLGVTQNTPVVVYDDTWGMDAARPFWSLENYGHRAVAVLDGGWDLWRTEGLPLEAGTAAIVPSHFAPQSDPDRIATYTWLNERLERGYADEVALAVVDVRSPPEYAGGHLPGAQHIHGLDELTNPDDLTRGQIHAQDALSSLLSRLGIENDDTIVFYDRSSNLWAARAYWALKYSGMAPCVYTTAA